MKKEPTYTFSCYVHKEVSRAIIKKQSFWQRLFNKPEIEIIKTTEWVSQNIQLNKEEADLMLHYNIHPKHPNHELHQTYLLMLKLFAQNHEYGFIQLVQGDCTKYIPTQAHESSPTTERATTNYLKYSHK